MKVVLLLGFLLACALSTQASANWDLSEVAQAEVSSAHADWSKSASGERKASNQGYSARYTQQGKLLKLELSVHKEKKVRVTDSDRLLFGMEATLPHHEEAMSNLTMSRAETVKLLKRSLGPNWDTMVVLPEEDLSYLETLRLAASLNEYNILASSGQKRARRGYGYEDGDHPGPWDCVCHGTDHLFPMSDHGQGVFWGIRVLQRWTRFTNPGHTPWGPPNCLLCDHETILNGVADTAAGFEYDCRWCCFGECVVGLSGQTLRDDDWPICDTSFQFDDFRSDPMNPDPSFNYYQINNVGACRLPRVFRCEAEVQRYCGDCNTFLNQLAGGSTDSDSENGSDLGNCDYCNLVVGGNPHLCSNCSYTMGVIEEYDRTRGFRDTGDTEYCSCNDAMNHIAKSATAYGFDGQESASWYYEGDRHDGGAGNGGYPYDYYWRTTDIDYNVDYDYDFRLEDGDYHENSQPTGYGPGFGYDGRPLRPSVDFDYDFRSQNYHEDSRPVDYDYDFRPPTYTVDYDFDYDYDFQVGGYHEDHRPYDYAANGQQAPPTYDYRYDYNGYRQYSVDYAGGFDGDNYAGIGGRH